MPKTARLAVIGGLTVKVPTECGSLYVQMNWQRGRIFEVFATLGKTGGCGTSQSEAITRSITLGLRSDVPVIDYVRQLQGIRCPTPHPFPKSEEVLSCADAMSRTLAKYGSLSIDEVVAHIIAANVVDDTIDTNKEAEVLKAMSKLAKAREEADL